MGAWVAITGKLPLEAWELGGAVALWVAGFDLFYALFDVEVDRARGTALGGDALRRPRRLLGRAPAARADGRAARARRARSRRSASGYWLGVAVVAALLAVEHALVSPGDLRRLNAAFFTMNGVISVVFFLFVSRRGAVVIRARGLAKRYGDEADLRAARARRRARRLRARHRAERLRQDDAPARRSPGLLRPTRRRARRRRRAWRSSASSRTSRSSTAS